MQRADWRELHAGVTLLGIFIEKCAVFLIKIRGLTTHFHFCHFWLKTAENFNNQLKILLKNTHFITIGVQRHQSSANLCFITKINLTVNNPQTDLNRDKHTAMMLPDVTEDELIELYSWLDTIPFSRAKKSIARDFADGVCVAEIIHHYFPRLVQLHNYRYAREALNYGCK